MQQTSPPPFNPYHSPSAPAAPGYYPPSGSAQVSARTIFELNGTRPWVKVLAIVSWIGSGLMVLAGLAMMLMGVLGAGGAAQTQGVGIGLGLFYLLFAALMIYPARKMSAYGKKIDDLSRSQSVQDLETALEQQRLVWRFYGVLAVIYFCVLAVAMLVAVLLPLLMK